MPYRLPDDLDVFSWSVPFLSEKVTNMLYNIIKREGDDDCEEVDLEKVLGNMALDEKSKRKLVMKGKINSVARMNRMYTTLRQESEVLLQIKNISPDGKLPRGILL